MTRGLLFDLDDTLYAREQFVQSGFEAVAQHVADRWHRSREGVLATLRHAHAHSSDRQEFQALCIEHALPLQTVPLLVKAFRNHRPTLTLLPAVRTALEHLRHDGWRIGVLTNGDPDVQRRKLMALGLEAVVDSVTYAEEHAVGGKPHPQAFAAGVERLGVSPQACVHVGDDPACDIAGAHAAGLRAIRVLAPPDWAAPGDTVPGWQCSDADATVDTVLDVAAIAPLVLGESLRGR